MEVLKKYIIRMILFLMIIFSFSIYSFTNLEAFFMTNSTLNTVITLFFIFGVFLMFRQILILNPEINWLNNFISETKFKNRVLRKPELLKPVAQIMESKTGALTLSQTDMRSILESIENRLVETRETSRYFIGLLIFLGLLGTFWGLLETINSVSMTIKGLDFSQDTDRLFFLLKESLEKPLGGMGTAFSSSLFGLGGSLILGFLDLQSSQAQNRFYNMIEEKLASFTKLTPLSEKSIKSDFAPAYIESLIENTSENLKKSEAEIKQQNLNQQMIVKSLSEINQYLSNNQSVNNELKDEIKILSKTIANITKK
tara:strand:+ start:19 stop:957 length:939 start_codon:yes stop_codon:yes gene_type:complete